MYNVLPPRKGVPVLRSVLPRVRRHLRRLLVLVRTTPVQGDLFDVKRRPRGSSSGLKFNLAHFHTVINNYFPYTVARHSEYLTF